MYTALYRKWRPLTFDDVISQPHITSALKNQIRSSRTAHAYLFTGSRGTGKTTCARILAKAVNCINPVNGNPCLECEICRNADLSALTDIIEIDAASNNGVDDVRDLRDSILYTPEQCRFKVYIIDEVHMLSASAFNALLKIMEEPPAYVRFILATTEIHKVPATILSRCQRFDFRRISSGDISERLMHIASAENIDLDESAADLIAKIADGGMRDAISLLDQCSAFDKTITAQTVSLASGTAGSKDITELLCAVTEKNPAEALIIIDKLYSLSKDMQRLCNELTMQFRNLMLIKSSVCDVNILSCMPDELEILKSLSGKYTLIQILEKLKILQECCSVLPKSINKRTELEMCVIELCMEHKSAEPVAVKASEPVVVRTPEPVIRSAQPKTSNKELKQSDFKQMKIWADILSEFEKLNPALTGALSQSKAFVNDVADTVLIMAQNPFFITLFKNNEENRRSLQSIISRFTGKHYAIIAKCTASADTGQKEAVKLIRKASLEGIPVEAEND